MLKQVYYDVESETLVITVNDCFVKMIHPDYAKTTKDNKPASFEFKVKVPNSRPKEERKSKTNKPPKLKQQLALAHQIQGFINTYQPKSMLELENYFSLSQSRICQIMKLLLISPKIQEEILLNNDKPVLRLSERAVRSIPMQTNWQKQQEIWQKIIQKHT